MTTESCNSLSFFQNRSIADTFDGYVVLGFVLTLIFTIILILCLVKYITYNLQRDKERERMIQERKVKPVRVEEENVDDSEEECGWSDNETADLVAEFREDNKTISVISDLKSELPAYIA